MLSWLISFDGISWLATVCRLHLFGLSGTLAQVFCLLYGVNSGECDDLCPVIRSNSLDESNGVNDGMVTTVFPPVCVEVVNAANNFWFWSWSVCICSWCCFYWAAICWCSKVISCAVSDIFLGLLVESSLYESCISCGLRHYILLCSCMWFMLSNNGLNNYLLIRNPTANLCTSSWLNIYITRASHDEYCSTDINLQYKVKYNIFEDYRHHDLGYSKSELRAPIICLFRKVHSINLDITCRYI